MTVETIIAELKSNADPSAVKGMARFGISSERTLGVPVPVLRAIARKTGKDHGVALGLWESGIHEARILASMLDDSKKVTKGQMEAWVKDFDSWDVCDQCCGNLFDRTPYAFEKAQQWSRRDGEFVRRAGYVLMAELAVHDKGAADSKFMQFFGDIELGATDSRNFVKKAVNWAIRQIGKRNARLNGEAVRLAKKVGRIDSPSAKWIASDALRELGSDAVREKLRRSS